MVIPYPGPQGVGGGIGSALEGLVGGFTQGYKLGLQGEEIAGLARYRDAKVKADAEAADLERKKLKLQVIKDQNAGLNAAASHSSPTARIEASKRLFESYGVPEDDPATLDWLEAMKGPDAGSFARMYGDFMIDKGLTIEEATGYYNKDPVSYQKEVDAFNERRKMQEAESLKPPAQRKLDLPGGGKLQEQYDTATRTWVPQGAPVMPEAYGDLTKGQSGIVNDVNKEARADPRVRQYNAVQPQIANARAGLAEQNAATDRAIVTTFSKLLDPTTGVLQGEAASAAGADTLFGWVQKAKGFVDKGQSIPPEIRKELVAGIERLNEGIRSNYDAAINEFGDQLEGQGIPRSHLYVREAAAPRTVSRPGQAPALPRSKTNARVQRWSGHRVVD